MMASTFKPLLGILIVQFDLSPRPPSPIEYRSLSNVLAIIDVVYISGTELYVVLTINE